MINKKNTAPRGGVFYLRNASLPATDGHISALAGHHIQDIATALEAYRTVGGNQAKLGLPLKGKGFWGCQPFKAGSFTGGVVFLSSLPFYQCFFIYKSQLKYRAPYRARYRKIRYSADSGATAASKISVTALSGASVKRDTATARIVPMIKPGTIS